RQGEGHSPSLLGPAYPRALFSVPELPAELIDLSDWSARPGSRCCFVALALAFASATLDAHFRFAAVGELQFLARQGLIRRQTGVPVEAPCHTQLPVLNWIKTRSKKTVERWAALAGLRKIAPSPCPYLQAWKAHTSPSKSVRCSVAHALATRPSL